MSNDANVKCESNVFWRLGALSDRELLKRMRSALGTSRRLVAELIAHLGEVEERRLHLAAACSSMFAYCLSLGMTEDEACRRIDVARLARRYPAIFPLLATGEVSLSLVALLKHYLSDENHLELLAMVSGRSVQQARELIAARFPRPDVASSVRKLPERAVGKRVVSADVQLPADSAPTDVVADGVCTLTGGANATASHVGAREVEQPSLSLAAPAAWPVRMQPARSFAAPTVSAGRVQQPSPIEPLSAQRYKVQFTAGAGLKSKIELARDLMRHALPNGDLGAIVERSLDLLIDDLMKRRFGANPRSKPSPAETVAVAPGPARTTAGEHHDATTHEDLVMHEDRSTPARVRSAYIPRATRRKVLERDGLGCSWVDERGVRCGGRAWLEYDHCHPRARGGGTEPSNLRLLCRNHNRWAAEAAYGREHVERAIAKQRRERAGPDDPRYEG